jgi:CheY-like chemotaxis protein
VVREMGGALVVSLGHDVITARDGIEAVELFDRHGKDIGCVVLDISMPRQDGWQTLAQLRRVRPDLAVVMVSGYERSQAMNHRDDANDVEFLHKPFTRREMETAIEKATGLTAGTTSP